MTDAPFQIDPVDARRDARAARRLLHRNRSVWVSVALVVAIALSVLAIIEAVRWALGFPPMAVPPALVRSALTEGGLWGGILAGGALLLGLLSLWGALAPGRTHRRVLSTPRAPVVVDDAVLAGALSRSAARAAGVAPTQVTTKLGGRRALISVQPSTGFDVDTQAVTRAGDDLLTAIGSGNVTARAQVAARGSLS